MAFYHENQIGYAQGGGSNCAKCFANWKIFLSWTEGLWVGNTGGSSQGLPGVDWEGYHNSVLQGSYSEETEVKVMRGVSRGGSLKGAQQTALSLNTLYPSPSSPLPPQVTKKQFWQNLPTILNTHKGQ
jgi:hypothetical protein